MKRPRFPIYQRSGKPRPMHFTARDSRILETVFGFDGVMADYQLRRLFFTGERQCRGRLSLLFQHGYLERPTRRQRAMLSSMIYWLGKRGAEHVAGLSGIGIKEFPYRREPRWAQIEHDLAVNDFRLDVMEAVKQTPALYLTEWIPEGEFWSHPDKVWFRMPNGKKASRLIRPDSVFVVQHDDFAPRHLLEIDRATEDNPRFTREKVLPGIAYLQSEAYRKRFGRQPGRWLVVTTTERRLHNLKKQAELAAGKEVKKFYFTLFDRVTPETVLTVPIWYRGGVIEPQALFQFAKMSLPS